MTENELAKKVFEAGRILILRTAKMIKEDRDMKFSDLCASLVFLVVENYFTTKNTKFFTKDTKCYHLKMKSDY